MDRRSFLAAMMAASATGVLRDEVLGQDIPPIEEPPADPEFVPLDFSRPWQTPAHAVNVAMIDAGSLGVSEASFQRYVWVPDGNPETAAAVVYAVNTAISSAPVAVQPVPVDGVHLLRWDLRKLAIDTKSFQRIVTAWDTKLCLREPYFLIRDKVVVGEELIDVERYQHTDGRWYTKKRVPKVVTKIDFGLHADRANGRILAALCSFDPNALFEGKACPIVRADWFMVQVLSTLNGGLYYDFRGIQGNTNEKDAKGNKLTDQQVFLRDFFGVDEAEAIAANAVSRAALRKSGVTGKKRRIDAFQGNKLRPTEGFQMVSITHDVFDEDVLNEDFDPIRNLSKFKERAREIIGPMPNGHFVYALFDNQGRRQDSVPDNIAIDDKIPSPYTKRLQPAISCLRCHGPHDGFIPFRNYIRDLHQQTTLRVFGDTAVDPAKQDDLTVLAGQYSGVLEPTMAMARAFHENAVFRSTGGRHQSDVAAMVVSLNNHYQFVDLTPDAICRELSIPVPSGANARDVFKAKVPIIETGTGRPKPEDVMIAGVQIEDISRADFEHFFRDVALRSMATAINESVQLQDEGVQP